MIFCSQLSRTYTDVLDATKESLSIIDQSLGLRSRSRWWPLSTAILSGSFYLSPISCYLAIACGTIAHNHNHRATFTSRRWNNGFGHVLTFFYGYPTLMWIPTHSLNHHHLRQSSRGRDSDLAVHQQAQSVGCPDVSVGLWLLPKLSDSPVHQPGQGTATESLLSDSVSVRAVDWGLCVDGNLGRHSVSSPTDRFGSVCLVLFGDLAGDRVSTTIMFFNFIQHVHTDAWSDHDHSRNFTGRMFNFLFFNNGYHTAHHNEPGLHWSELPLAHAKIAGTINPELNEKNLAWFMIRQYLLSWLFPALGTKQLGSLPSDVPKAI